ncbi:MAG: hypothetical protein LJE91_06100 [Gammaproteobacteria bacterium]|jgi:hypothetical protein|nr:hypothetical protein [Gammaproteobacteria bacterium]
MRDLTPCILKSLPCRVILSGYPSTLYDGMLEDWNCVALQTMTWGGPRTEKLWYNYDIDRAHWATYAGKDFTDRQRIKRKAERWAKNYQALPPPVNGSLCWRQSWRWRRINDVTAPAVKGNGLPGPDKAGLENCPRPSSSR